MAKTHLFGIGSPEWQKKQGVRVNSRGVPISTRQPQSKPERGSTFVVHTRVLGRDEGSYRSRTFKVTAVDQTAAVNRVKQQYRDDYERIVIDHVSRG